MILTHGANSIGSGGGGENVIGGREYAVVDMPDGHTWLAENLDFKFCDIGGGDTPSNPHAWYYNNNEATYGLDGVKKCGLLYNWVAVQFLNDNRETLCPGWHVPTKSEWDALVNAAGGSSIAGQKLKALDNSITSGFPSGWYGTDNYGFRILPCGDRYLENFRNDYREAYLWTSTPYDSGDAYTYAINTGNSAYVKNYNKTHAYSVRLIKDY